MLAALVLTLALCPGEDPACATWARRIEWPEGEGPNAREHAALVLDAARERLVLFFGSGYVPYGTPLGDVWSFDLATDTWTELGLAGDAIVAAGARRAAPTARGVVLHGGYGAGLTPLAGLFRLELEDDHVWVEELEQHDPPPARALHGFAHDAERARFIVYGGATDEQVFGDTWIGEHSAAGVRWEELDAPDGPGPRFGFAFAHDAARERLLVCGGQLPPESADARVNTARDLWALDLRADAPTWALIAEYEEQDFPGRRNPAFAFDEASGDLLVWGGTGDGASALEDLFVVHTRQPDAPVQRVPQAATLPTRASGFGVVDPRARRAYLGFGNTASGRYTDLVEVRLGAAGEKR